MRQAHEFADYFPLMEGSDYDELKADIAANGVRIPIWIFEEKTLDGRNRERACEELGKECPAMPFMGTSDEALRFVASLNLKRRHLSTSQRAAIAAEIATAERGSMKGNQYTGKMPAVGNPPIGGLPDIQKSTADAAKLMNVGTRSVERAKEVKRNNPEAFKAVKAGKLSVNKAHKETRKAAKAKPPKPVKEPTPPKLNQFDQVATEYDLPMGTFASRKEAEDMKQLTLYMSPAAFEKFQKAAEHLDQSPYVVLAEHVAEHIRPANHKPVPRYDDFNRLKPGEKTLVEMGLTREEVDPDFKGSDFDFQRKYGHILLRRKSEIDFAAAAQRGDALLVALKNLLSIMPRQPVTETDILAWIEAGKKIGGRRERKLLERMLAFKEVASWLLPLIEQVEALVGPMAKENS